MYEKLIKYKTKVTKISSEIRNYFTINKQIVTTIQILTKVIIYLKKETDFRKNNEYFLNFIIIHLRKGYVGKILKFLSDIDNTGNTHTIPPSCISDLNS